MTDPLSIAGLTADLRDMQVGASIARAGRVPTDQAPDLTVFRKSIMAAVAKSPGDFTAATLDRVTDDFRHAIRCVVITRIG